MSNERKDIENIKFHSARGDKIVNIMRFKYHAICK